jgi:TRAP-type mannitol/chloroaromatic compound transport system substrate-binding protein
MGMSSRRQFLSTATALLGSGVLLSGCNKKETSAASNAPVSQEKIHWKLVTSWPANFPGLGTAANRIAELINRLSGGRLDVKVFAAGELVGALEVFDAVSAGTAQLGHSGAYYWKGKSRAAQFFSSVPFGLTAQEMNAWLFYGDGMKLWEEVYKPFGLVPSAGGNSGTQMGGWFNKEINSVEDFKGLKMRMPGLGGDVIQRLGAIPVNLPGGEIFSALQSGAIDATEWVGPYNDQAFGLYKAAKNYYAPGWHEPGTVMECMINEQALMALPEDLQEIVKGAIRLVNHDMLAEFTMRNQLALQELEKAHGVQVKFFPDDVMRALKKVSDEVLDEEAAKDPLSAKVWASQKAFREAVTPWTNMAEGAIIRARQL